MNENQLYFAPMEGITGSIYRRAHHRIFGGVRRSTMRDVGLFHSFCQIVQRIL